MGFDLRSLDVRWIATLLVGAGVLVAGLALMDRQSVERGNRLYRSGDASGAVDVYRSSVADAPRGRPLVPYNLGTALLHLDPEEAELQLRTALEGLDGAGSQRGFYNLGYRYLSAVSGAMAADSQAVVLEEAVSTLRAALRLDPRDASARWNLALAQRRLDALSPPGGDAEEESGGTTDDELVVDDQALARSETADAVSGLEPENPRPADNRGERQGALEGAREAWAVQDPGPLTLEAAQGLLNRVEDDPEALIRGILWSHRPDIAWWESQPYPGGSW